MTQRQLLGRGLTTVALLGILAASSLGPSAVADEGPHIVPTETPIPMGVSGGNINHWANVDGDPVCRTGTLGSLVEKDNVRYILSNNHVLARLNQAALNEVIIQPGLVDQLPTKCISVVPDTVAHLSAFVQFTTQCTPLGGKAYRCPPPNNVVDAAIAEVVPNSVSADILDIGPICNDFSSLTPDVDTPVVKSGRTSGLTFGNISAVDADVAVEYRCLECTDPLVFLFVDQILIKPGSFVAAGDSGSLVVSAVDHRPVGLIFAGSKRAAVANRFNRVAEALGVTPVGDSPGDVDTVCDTTIDGGGSSGGPGGGPGNGRGRPSSMAQIPFDFEHVRNVRARHTDLLFGFPGVVGSGVSVDDAGNFVIEVYLAEGGNIEFADRRIPQQLEGIAVRQVITGPFVAY